MVRYVCRCVCRKLTPLIIYTHLWVFLLDEIMRFVSLCRNHAFMIYLLVLLFLSVRYLSVTTNGQQLVLQHSKNKITFTCPPKKTHCMHCLRWYFSTKQVVLRKNGGKPVYGHLHFLRKMCWDRIFLFLKSSPWQPMGSFIRQVDGVELSSCWGPVGECWSCF